MKFAIHTAVLLLLFGTTISASARQEGKGEQKDEAKPAEAAKPAARPQAPPAKPVQQAKPAPRQQAQTKPATQAKPAPRQVARQTKPATQAKPAPRQQAQAKSGNPGNSAHGRISDAHYSASFGNSHSFHVNQGEFNNHRFAYGGYSFGFIDPWPVGWLYTDAVYVDYVDGGYYMFDPFHPGIRLSINIL